MKRQSLALSLLWSHVIFCFASIENANKQLKKHSFELKADSGGKNL